MENQQSFRWTSLFHFVIPVVFLAFPAPGQAATFFSVEQALQVPETATELKLQGNDPEVRHLSSSLCRLIHLRVLHIQCMEALEDLPIEIGLLTELEELIIDNGTGCTMNVALPESLGRLHRLRVLTLYGALDPRDGNLPVPPERIKPLPDSLSQLIGLEELNIGRNGLTIVPPQIAALRNLRVLNLGYNNIATIPDFVGTLDRLQELSLESNSQGMFIPNALTRIKGIKLNMGNSFLTLQQQKELQDRFPDILFSFSNEYEDAASNEEVNEPEH
jgi:Leucine-rich repeat (LRR) protein